MTVAVGHQDPAFVHEAFLYRGPDEFLRGMLQFIRDGIEAGEPVFVVLNAEKIARLREALGEDADRVLFADMAEVGANPARIIAAWHEFVDEHGAGGRRSGGSASRSGPGAATRSSRSATATSRSSTSRSRTPRRSGSSARTTSSALDPGVVEEAERTHPFMSDVESFRESGSYRGLEAISAPFAAPLEDPPASAARLTFDADSLGEVRDLVTDRAEEAGFDRETTDALVLAVNEIATNSIRHGGGSGVIRSWDDGSFLLFQVEDGGRIDAPLAGRRQPVLDEPGGRGLWLANQLCDLVQVRTFENGNVVRIHMATGS